MKKILIAISLLFLMTSCASQKKVILNYDKTNPVRIEMANQGLDLTSVLPSVSDVDGTIAVRSIEGAANGHLDAGVIYSIEDNLVSNLLEAGYRVVERDPDALDNLYKEESTKYSKNGPNYRMTDDALIYEDGILNDLNPTSNLVVIGDEGKESSNVSGCCDKNDQLLDYIVDEHKMLSEVEKNSLEDGLVGTGLSASDYILSYRVLECGVNYYAVDKTGELFKSSFNVEEQLERSARTRLHCRLTDSKTSEIVAAGLVEHEVSDLINKADVKALQQMSYKYYHHTLPNMNMGDYRETTGYAKANEEASIEKASKRKRTKEEKKEGMFSKIFGMF